MAVVAAFLIDLLCGEPPARWHPVVWIGRALSSVGAPWPQAAPCAQFARGAAVWLALALVCVAAGIAADRSIAAIAAVAPPALDVLPQQGIDR